MEGLLMFLGSVYLGGLIVSIFVMRSRAGVGVWYGLQIFGPGGFGPVWAGTLVVCSMAWPVTLAVWLARGRPEPRIVFNEKAAERQRRQVAGGAR